MKTAQSRQRGSALLLATVVVLIIAGLAAAFVTLTTSQSNATRKSSNSETALYVAEAGLEDTINLMNAYVIEEWTWLSQNKTMTPTNFVITSSKDYAVFR